VLQNSIWGLGALFGGLSFHKPRGDGTVQINFVLTFAILVQRGQTWWRHSLWLSLLFLAKHWPSWTYLSCS